MDDLKVTERKIIYLDDAIDVIDNHQFSIEYCKDHNIDRAVDVSMAKIALESLSSAQGNIIRCKDCEKHGSIYCTMSEEFDNGTKPEDFCSYAENTCENTCDFTRMSHAKDTIYRQDAIYYVKQATIGETDVMKAWVKAQTHLMRLPSAQPERKKGEWVNCVYSEHWKCSCCGTRASYWLNEENSSEWDNEMSEWLSDFCPNCGSYNGGNHMTNDRDCDTCAYQTRYGCSSWDCNYINRHEAIEAYKRQKAMEDDGK